MGHESEFIPDEDPYIIISLGDEKIRCTPENTTLYTFAGKTALGDTEFNNANVNHVFIRRQEGEDGQVTGMHLFEAFHSAYSKVATYMAQNEFPMVANMRELPPCDMQAYMMYVETQVAQHATQLPDFLPSDFEA